MSGRQIRQPVLSPLGQLRRFAVCLFAATFVLSLLGCATGPVELNSRLSLSNQARQALRNSRSRTISDQQAAAWDLAAADLASRDLNDPAMVRTYNSACADFSERIYQTPISDLQEYHAGARSYRVHSQPAGKGGWAPAYFQKVKAASKIKPHLARTSVLLPGVGGPLVGIHRASDPNANRASFAPRNGFHVPLTASLDFNESQTTNVCSVSWQLSDPTDRDFVLVRGKRQHLAADFTAPLNYFPKVNQLWLGFLGMLNADRVSDRTGLYLLEPYRGDRIPVLFVHGLLSVPEMWVPTINELNKDPTIRKQYQFWVFSYPTGLPVPLSALYLRDDLTKAERLYQPGNGMVLVGHSMGGILSRVQATDSGRVIWDKIFGANAARVYARTKTDSLIKRALIFPSDSNVRRIVFMNTPHRGSQLAIGFVGRLAIRLIRLPLTGEKGRNQSRVPGLVKAPSGSTTWHKVRSVAQFLIRRHRSLQIPAPVRDPELPSSGCHLRKRT